MGSVNYDDETRSVISDVGDIGNVDFANDGSSYNYNPENEGPIVISVPFPLADGKPQFVPVGETVFNAITIENTSTEAATLWSVEIYDSKPEKCFTLSVMEPPSPNSDEDYVKSFVDSFSLEDRTLVPGKTLTIYLLCKPTDRGLHTTAVHFSIDDVKIERMGFIIAEDKISRSLTSKKPYNRPNRNKPMLPRIYSPGGDNSGLKVMRGYRPAKANSRPYRYKLPDYPIPKDIRDVIQNKGVPDALMEGLTKKNYVPFFKTLINMEEIKLEEDMRTYDMQGVVFKRKYRLLSLEVPGLAERRPSLVVGDFIAAKPTFQNEYNTSPLYTDEHWNKLLWHCADNDSYKGCFLPDKEEIVNVGPETEQYNSSNWQGNWNDGDPTSFNGWNANENGDFMPPAPGANNDWDVGSCDWNANQNGNFIPPAPGGDDDWGVGPTASDNMGDSTIQTPSGAADCKDDSTDIPTETTKWSEYPSEGPTGASDNWGEGSSEIYAGTSDNWGEGQTDVPTND
ncbi:RNA helicase SDE3 [Artemisia annua]|uniref:RNA helicase SDE3 n=1 Tax=Artemisia annua TaxID=35608 RepID=A0A2U1MIE4_ARTAN|nr:RNA helicase SDE3 [Artemisia annua]